MTNFQPPSEDPKVTKNREIQARYRAKIRNKRREWNKQWQSTNAERYTYLRVQSNARRRRKVLLLYANPPKCSMCGFSDLDGLVLDHINDDGVQHRKELKVNSRGGTGGGSIYEIILRKGKIDKLQILCATCNTMKHVRRLRARSLGGDIEKISTVLSILAGGE